MTFTSRFEEGEREEIDSEPLSKKNPVNGDGSVVPLKDLADDNAAQSTDVLDQDPETVVKRNGKKCNLIMS